MLVRIVGPDSFRLLPNSIAAQIVTAFASPMPLKLVISSLTESLPNAFKSFFTDCKIRRASSTAVSSLFPDQ
jgi:hypothetical protein